MRSTILISVAAIATLFAVAGCTDAPAKSRGSEAAAQPTTVDIQGADEWKRAPQMHAYYDETVATFKNGTDIDVAAYEARSFAIFREFARAKGMNEAAMIDHLKLIPRQVVGIVKENPAVLQDYDAFWAALAGPD
jgi:uncharacterized protein YyaL (SSP411 family)